VVVAVLGEPETQNLSVEIIGVMLKLIFLFDDWVKSLHITSIWYFYLEVKIFSEGIR